MSVHAHVHVCMIIRNKFACKSSYFLKLISKNKSVDKCTSQLLLELIYGERSMPKQVTSAARKDKSVDNCTSQLLLALIPPHTAEGSLSPHSYSHFNYCSERCRMILIYHRLDTFYDTFSFAESNLVRVSTMLTVYTCTQMNS